MSTRTRTTLLVLAAGAIVALGVVSAQRVDTRAPAPARFPVQHLAPGDVPALWVFVRGECPACRRHLRALQDALAGLDAATRARAARRIHVVGDAPCSATVHRHARSWLRTLDVAATPLTWWIAADSTIARTWLGPRDLVGWQHAVRFTLGGAP